MYTIPGFLLVLGGLWCGDAAASLGAPEQVTIAIAAVPTLVFLLMVPVIFLSFMDVPMPRFTLPKWIQEQDRERTRAQTVTHEYKHHRRATTVTVDEPGERVTSEDLDQCLGEGTQSVEVAEIPWILRLPAGWEVDLAGAADGVIAAREAEPGSMDFHPNLTLICAPLPDGFTGEAVEQTRVDQGLVDQHYRQKFSDYHLVDLSIQNIGRSPEPAVYRLAMYTNGDGTPVMLAQFITRAHGCETTLSLTWATADYQWIGNSQAIAVNLERK